MERAAPVPIKHMLDPGLLPKFLRTEQVLCERGRPLAPPHDQLPQIGWEALVGARLERLHGGDDGQGALQQEAAGVVEDEGEVAAEDARFGVPVVGADVVGREVAEVFDEDLLGQGQEAEVGGELLVVSWRVDFEIAAVEPVDKEFEGGVVVVGEVELFGLGFGEFALEGRFEVVGAVAEQVFVEAEGLALGSDEDVDHLDGQKSVTC